ncbi:hypothetical protein ZIOFF_004413 [Zingiber officinale]|uniref:Uncharacterized protein n=1 Tax=Zingiber officinale TaxID=94328 RepID=A0A8J5M0D5_ZINOF|nr:hypothetical protein ZIOFF_004413 [Zingiber officinale]
MQIAYECAWQGFLYERIPPVSPESLSPLPPPANSVPLRRSTSPAESLPFGLNLITANICAHPNTATDWYCRTHQLYVSRSVLEAFHPLIWLVTALHKSVFNFLHLPRRWHSSVA